MTLARTPYDGSATPFTIGLRQLDVEEWIEPDSRLVEQLVLKEELYRTVFDTVFAAEPDTGQTQEEVLTLLAEYLPRRFPETYRRAGEAIEIVPAGRRVEMSARPALVAASMLVQEDLVIMRRSGEGWRLAAAALCFPSSWSLAEKFGHTLEEIHRFVPGFAAGTRQAMVLRRIFDSLDVARPVERMNWSLQETDELFLPRSKSQRDAGAAGRPGGMLGSDPLAAAFIRVERQTLRMLPDSGDILFTIRVHLDPMERLAAHPDRARLAASMAGQLAALDADQMAYKGIVETRDRLVATLRQMAER